MPRKVAYVAIMLVMLAHGCAVRRAQRVMPEPTGELPPPISVPIQSSPVVPSTDPISRLHSRLKQIGRENVLMVRARVISTDVREGRVPDILRWDPGTRVLTEVTVKVQEVICGRAGENTTFIYHGGQLSNGVWERTEQMPRDLGIDEDAVFILRSVEGRLFLELGMLDMLRKDENGVYRDPSALVVDLNKLKEVCP